MHAEEVRRRAKAGLLPGAKLGKRWVFILEDLAEYVRSHYSESRQALRVTWRKEVTECHSADAVTRGGLISPLQAVSELDALLAQPRRPKLKNSTTS